MPYEYFFFLTIVFAVLFATACFYFLWVFFERTHKKYLIFSLVFAVITGCLVWLSIWTHSKMIEQEQGVEIKRITGSESELDKSFLDYYKKSAQGNFKYKFDIVLDDKNYISISEVEELFGSQYNVIYHINRKEQSNE